MKKKLGYLKLGLVSTFVMCLLLGTGYTSQGMQTTQRDYYTPDLVLLNGKIITVDEDFLIAEALAMRGDTITAVGKTEDIKSLVGPKTRILDLQGKTVIPGLQDSHIHFVRLGWNLHYQINLMDATNVNEIQKLVREKASKTKPGDWILGFSWDWRKIQKDKQGAMANRFELDEAAPNNPVHLNYVEDGWAFNTLAMKLNGMDEYWEWWRKDPPWTDELNYIERFTSGPHKGEPTGVFYGETTIDELRKVVGAGARTLAEKVQSVLWGQEEMLSCGVTSIIDPGIADISPYQHVYNAGKLKLRVTAYLRVRGSRTSIESDKKLVETLSFSNLGDDHLRWRGAKYSADGGIGSLNAAVSEPFEFGMEYNYGRFRRPENIVAQLYKLVTDHGWELHTHCTGDRGLAQTTRLYEKVMGEVKKKRPDADLRYSTIHTFLPIEPKTMVINDLARLGIVAMVNSVFYYDLGDSFHEFIGDERIARFCPVKSLMEAGVVVAGGSDYSVCQHDPWKGMFAMVTRIIGFSREVWGPEERVTIEDALKTYTINGAYLTYDENKRGSLEVGKYADMVVLNKDTLADPMELETMKDEVMMTFVDGKVAWRSPKCDLTF